MRARAAARPRRSSGALWRVGRRWFRRPLRRERLSAGPRAAQPKAATSAAGAVAAVLARQAAADSREPSQRSRRRGPAVRAGTARRRGSPRASIPAQTDSRFLTRRRSRKSPQSSENTRKCAPPCFSRRRQSVKRAEEQAKRRHAWTTRLVRGQRVHAGSQSHHVGLAERGARRGRSSAAAAMSTRLPRAAHAKQRQVSGEQNVAVEKDPRNARRGRQGEAGQSLVEIARFTPKAERNGARRLPGRPPPRKCPAHGMDPSSSLLLAEPLQRRERAGSHANA